MKLLLPVRHLHRACLLSAVLLSLCSQSALVRAAGPLPVPIPPGPGVAITNPGAIAKAEGIQHPFQHTLECKPDGPNCDGSFKLPENRRIVLEYISVICAIPEKTLLQVVGVKTTIGGTEVLHALNHEEHPPLDAALPHLAVAAQTVKLYADAGSTVRFFAAVTSAGTPDWSCNASLSGQSVDVP